MESESIVYGCIRDWPSADLEQCRQRRANNLAAVQALQGEAWPFIGREMFSFCRDEDLGLYQTQVIHFGASYRAVEYEWALWVQRFEALLKQLYWTSAVVHLETELNGTHTFAGKPTRVATARSRATCACAAPGSGKAGCSADPVRLSPATPWARRA